MNISALLLLTIMFFFLHFHDPQNKKSFAALHQTLAKTLTTQARPEIPSPLASTLSQTLSEATVEGQEASGVSLSHKTPRPQAFVLEQLLQVVVE